jgi:hypothetical protein
MSGTRSDQATSAKADAFDKSCRQTAWLLGVAAFVAACSWFEVNLRIGGGGGESLLVPLIWASLSSLITASALTARLVLGGLRHAAYAEDLDIDRRRREATSR